MGKDNQKKFKMFRKASIGSKVAPTTHDESKAKILIKEDTGNNFRPSSKEKEKAKSITSKLKNFGQRIVEGSKEAKARVLKRIRGETKTSLDFYRRYLTYEERHLRRYAIQSKLDISTSEYLKNQEFLRFNMPRFNRYGQRIKEKRENQFIQVSNGEKLEEVEEKVSKKEWLKERFTPGMMVLSASVLIVAIIEIIRSSNILETQGVKDDVIALVLLYVLIVSKLVLIPVSFIFDLGLNRLVLKIPSFLGLLSFSLSFLISNDSQKRLQNFGAVLLFAYASINCSLLLLDNLIRRSIGEFKSRVVIAVDYLLVCILALLYEDKNGFFRFLFLGIIGLNILGITYEINSMMFKFNLKEFEEEVNELHEKMENRNLTYIAFSPSNKGFRRFLERISKIGKHSNTPFLTPP